MYVNWRMLPSRITLKPSVSNASSDRRVAINCNGWVISPYRTAGIGNVKSRRTNANDSFRSVPQPPIMSRQPASESRNANRENVEELARVAKTPRQAAKARTGSAQKLGVEAGRSTASRFNQARYAATTTEKRR